MTSFSLKEIPQPSIYLRECRFCGEEFQPTTTNNWLCGDACKAGRERQLQRERHAVKIARRGILKQCQDCGSTDRTAFAARSTDRCTPCWELRLSRLVSCFPSTPVEELRKRDNHLSTSYGIGLGVYYLLLEEQQFRCAICDTESTGPFDFAVDHDHSCCAGPKSCGRCVRGLLCIGCNLHLGWYEARGEAASKYLAR